jgi:hypothetical protein
MQAHCVLYDVWYEFLYCVQRKLIVVSKYLSSFLVPRYEVEFIDPHIILLKLVY